jgi:exosortase
MTTPAQRPKGTGAAVAAAVLVVALAAAVYGRTFVTLWGTWLSNPNYSHGYLIPPVAAFVLWLERRRFAASVGRGTPWGLAVAVVALAVHLLSIRAGVFMTQGYSFVLLLFGVSLLFFGGRATRVAWFGLGYLVFMLPMPPFLMNVVSFNLKLLAARAGSAIAAHLGIPLVRSGVTIHLPAGSLRIADPCSGLRSLIALVALGALYAYLMKGPTWKRVVLFASAVPLAVIANVVRISVLCAVANVWGVDTALGFFHDFSGLFLFLIAFAGLVVVRKVLRIDAGRKEGA